MKHLFTMAIVLCLSWSTIQAQNIEKGLRAAFNLSNLYVEDFEDETMKPGFAAGVFVEVGLAKSLSVRGELNYSVKGSQLKYDGPILGKGAIRYNLNYIDIPVLLNISVADQLYLEAGPYAAYLVSANVKDVDDSGNVRTTLDLGRDNFNSLDYGLAIGAGFKLPLGHAGIRYSHGLNNIANSDPDIETAKHSVIQFLIGFSL